MVVRVIDQTVVGIQDAFGTAITAVIVDIAFVPLATVLFRKKTFSVAEFVAADGHFIGNIPKISLAADPAKLRSFILCDVVGRKLVKGVNVGSN